MLLWIYVLAQPVSPCLLIQLPYQAKANHSDEIGHFREERKESYIAKDCV